MSLTELGAHILVGLFAIGVAGCLITIPLCAYKFFSVLLEKDPDESNGSEVS